MRTLGILKQKGGSGATTIAVHLAIAAQEAGRRVVIVDVDPQGSATSWGNARESEDVPVIAATIDQLAAIQEAAATDSYDLVLIDTPPHSSAATAAVARVSDFALIPTRPSALDLAAVPAMLGIVEATGTPSMLVLNACPPRAPEVQESRGVLEQTGVEVWEGQLGDRVAFRRAVATGHAVTEPGSDPDGKASEEIRALWSYIAAKLA